MTKGILFEALFGSSVVAVESFALEVSRHCRGAITCGQRFRRASSGGATSNVRTGPTRKTRMFSVGMRMRRCSLSSQSAPSLCGFAMLGDVVP